MPVEIERKFLVKQIPDNLDEYEKIEMIQGYLNFEPVVRVRKENEEYFLTYKSKGLLKREEYNLPIDESSFKNLIKKCDGNIINKTRYKINLENGLVAELDIFKGDLSGLVLVEVEFDSIKDSLDFKVPDWFSTEVTNDYKYQNSNLAKVGFSDVI